MPYLTKRNRFRIWLALRYRGRPLVWMFDKTKVFPWPDIATMMFGSVIVAILTQMIYLVIIGSTYQEVGTPWWIKAIVVVPWVLTASGLMYFGIPGNHLNPTEQREFDKVFDKWKLKAAKKLRSQ